MVWSSLTKRLSTLSLLEVVSCKLHDWNVSLRQVSVGRSRAWWDHGIGGRRWFILPRRHTGQDVVNPSARGAWMRRLQVSGRTTGIAAVVVLSLLVRSSRWLARWVTIYSRDPGELCRGGKSSNCTRKYHSDNVVLLLKPFSRLLLKELGNPFLKISHSLDMNSSPSYWLTF